MSTQSVPESVLGQLRASRLKLHSDKTKMILIPGYSPPLVARYKRLPWETIRPLATALSGDAIDASQEVSTAMDVLLAACDGFLSRDDDGNYQELGLRYEQGLAELLDDHV